MKKKNLNLSFSSFQASFFPQVAWLTIYKKYSTNYARKIQQLRSSKFEFRGYSNNLENFCKRFHLISLFSAFFHQFIKSQKMSAGRRFPDVEFTYTTRLRRCLLFLLFTQISLFFILKFIFIFFPT
jgi:hypothetical protein